MQLKVACGKQLKNIKQKIKSLQQNTKNHFHLEMTANVKRSLQVETISKNICVLFNLDSIHYL